MQEGGEREEIPLSSCFKRRKKRWGNSQKIVLRCLWLGALARQRLISAVNLWPELRTEMAIMRETAESAVIQYIDYGAAQKVGLPSLDVLNFWRSVILCFSSLLVVAFLLSPAQTGRLDGHLRALLEVLFPLRG